MVSRKILFFNLFFFFNVTCKRCWSNKWTDMLKFMKLAETRFELIQLERETWSRKSVFVHVFMSNPIENSVSDAQKIIIIEMSPRTSIFWVLHSYQFTPRKIWVKTKLGSYTIRKEGIISPQEGELNKLWRALDQNVGALGSSPQWLDLLNRRLNPSTVVQI